MWARSSVVLMVGVAAMVIMIMIGGATSEKVNDTKKEGVIGYTELESEFEMSSEIYRRILKALQPPGTGPTNNPNKPAVECDRPGYRSCIAPESGGKGYCRDTRNRNC